MGKVKRGITVVSVAVCAFAGAADKTLFRDDFDGDLSHWRGLGGGWSVEAGVGADGSRALVWRTPKDGKKPSLLQYPLTAFRPGMKLEVSCRAKIVEAGAKPPPAKLCDIEWWDLEGKWSGGAGMGFEAIFSRLPVDGEGWSEIRFEVPHLQSDVSRSVFEFFTLPASSGVVAVDDLLVRVIDRRALTMPVSSAYRGKSREGSVSFSSGLGFDPKDTPIDTLRCTFTFKGASGDVRTVSADEICRRWARVTLKTEDFAVGVNDVRVTLSTLEGKTLDSRTIPFERLAPGAKMPRVYLDGCGRAIVNGRRFFPLGMFWHDGDLKEMPDALELYAKGPFNCLQTYDMPMNTDMLDKFWKHGLYVMPTLCSKTYLLNSMKKRPRYSNVAPLPGLETEEDARAELARYVNSLKRHPAVLAWYTSDEFFPWMGPLYAQRAELIRRIDPDHPHYGVGNMEAYVPYLRGGFDVFGIDYYCIRMRGDSPELLEPDRAAVWRGVEKLEKMRDACGGILHQWPVPQAYARGWDYRRSMKNDEWRKLRFPTAKEFRAMCWQYIAAGANGLVHYAYGQMLHWNRKAKIFGDEEFKESWKSVCDASAEVKAQIPVILKDEGPKPRNVPADARVRTWRDDDAVYALICNLKPRPLSGTVDIDFAGSGIERLTGEGTVARSVKGLTFGLGPFEHALVKIPRASAED